MVRVRSCQHVQKGPFVLQASWAGGAPLTATVVGPVATKGEEALVIIGYRGGGRLAAEQSLA